MVIRQYRKKREIKKWKFSFFCQRQTLLISFDIFVVTYRVTNFLPKLLDMLLFSTEKTELPFFGFPLFSGYAWSSIVNNELAGFCGNSTRRTHQRFTMSTSFFPTFAGLLMVIKCHPRSHPVPPPAGVSGGDPPPLPVKSASHHF